MSTLTVVTSLRPEVPEDAAYPRCFEVWGHLSDALEASNLSTGYEFSPSHVGHLLTFLVPEANQSQRCRVEYLPFKPAAFTCLLAILITSLVGNLTVFASLYANRRRWSKVNHFIMHLAIADLAVLVTPLVEVITMLTHTWYGGRSLCKIYRLLSAFGLYLSSFIVTSIAVDRYMAISRPLSITTANRRAKVLLIASLVVALVCSLPQASVFDLFESNFFKSHNLVCIQAFSVEADGYKRQIYALFAFLMMYGLPLMTIAWCYSRILCVLTNKTREHRENCICHHSASLTDSVDSTRHGNSTTASAIAKVSLRRSDVRNIERARMCTLRMTVIIVLGFLLCWAPHWIVTLFDTFADSGNMSDATTDLVYLGLTCAFFNSCINPIIYGMFTKHCASCLKRHCSCLERCRTGSHQRPQRKEDRQQQQQQQQQMLLAQRQRLLTTMRSGRQQQQQQHYQMIPMRHVMSSSSNTGQRNQRHCQFEEDGGGCQGCHMHPPRQQLRMQPRSPAPVETLAQSSDIKTAAATGTAAGARADDLLQQQDSSSSGSGSQHQQQLHQSARRLERNAFDKVLSPLYAIEVVPRQV